MQISIIFPGQGSQSVGMLSAYYQNNNIVKETFSEASDVLGYDLLDMVLNGPEDKLNKTENTQPALLCSSVAIYRIWQQNFSTEANSMAGHSLGEYSALVCASAIHFQDAVKLVSTRGQLMQSAVAEGVGSMAAILGIDDEKIVELCTEISNENASVSAANYNSPGQVVVAGHKPAVERLVAAAKESGAKRSVILPVSVPSHCALMRNAAEAFKEHLNQIEIQSPQFPVLHNIDAQIRTDASEIRNALEQQLYCPVQWTTIVRKLIDDGVTHVLECGPGKVLSGLVRRIDRSLTALPLQEPQDMEKAIETLSGDE